MKLIRKAKQAAIVAFMSFLSSPVFASGASLPWDGPLTTLRNNLTGPFAVVISAVAFVGAGVALAFGGDDLSGISKRLLFVVLAICIVVFGVQFMSALGITSSGALV